MNSLNKYYKIFIGLFELLLAVPFLGATIVFGSGWTVLGLLIFLHIVGIIVSILTKQAKAGHIFGIVANLLAIIPFVGMLVHAITGIVLLIEGFSNKTTSDNRA